MMSMSQGSCLSLDDWLAIVNESMPALSCPEVSRLPQVDDRRTDDWIADQLSPPPSCPEVFWLSQVDERLADYGFADQLTPPPSCPDVGDQVADQVADKDFDVCMLVECGLLTGDQLSQLYICIQIAQQPTVEEEPCHPPVLAQRNESDTFQPHCDPYYAEGVDYAGDSMDWVEPLLGSYRPTKEELECMQDLYWDLSWCESENEAPTVRKRKRPFKRFPTDFPDELKEPEQIEEEKKLRRKKAVQKPPKKRYVKHEPVVGQPLRFTRSVAFNVGQDSVDLRLGLPAATTTRSTFNKADLNLADESVKLVDCYQSPPEGYAVRTVKRTSDNDCPAPLSKRSRNDSDDLGVQFIKVESVPKRILVNRRKGQTRKKATKRDWHCIKCNGSYNASLSGAQWVQCLSCTLWCHEDCAEGDTEYFNCHKCAN